MKRYGEIYEVFRKHQFNSDEVDETFGKKIGLYYEDFLRALSIHGNSNRSADQESAERRFYERLYCLSKG